MVDIFILVPTSISHRIIFGRLAYHGKILDFPSAYHNVMASSLPSFSPSEGFRFRTSSQVQRSRKRFVNLAKQDPGRAKQNSQATAGTNFTKPRTSHLRDPCTRQKLNRCLSTWALLTWHAIGEKVTASHALNF